MRGSVARCGRVGPAERGRAQGVGGSVSLHAHAEPRVFPAYVSSEMRKGIRERLEHLQRAQMMAATESESTRAPIFVDGIVQAGCRRWGECGCSAAGWQRRSSVETRRALSAANLLVASSRPTLWLFREGLPQREYADVSDQARLPFTPAIDESQSWVRSSWAARMLDKTYLA